jgi:hypothetical protein
MRIVIHPSRRTFYTSRVRLGLGREFPCIGEQYCTAGRLQESAESDELYQGQGGKP